MFRDGFGGLCTFLACFCNFDYEEDFGTFWDVFGVFWHVLGGFGMLGDVLGCFGMFW